MRGHVPGPAAADGGKGPELARKLGVYVHQPLPPPFSLLPFHLSADSPQALAMAPSLADAVHFGRGHTAPTLLRGYQRSISFVAFLSDDDIISASEDTTILRWSLSKGRNQPFMQGVSCVVATSPNKRWLAMGWRDLRVKLWDLETLKEPMTSDGRHVGVIKSLAFSPDSSQLASGAQDGTMLVWSTASLKQVAGPFKGHKDSVWWICYSPDGKKIASCDRESIQIWDTASTTCVGVPISEKAWSLAWSSDGSSLLAGCIDGAIKHYNPDNGTLLTSYMGHCDVVFSIVLSHNAKFFATASWDKTIRLWEAATFQQIGPALSQDTRVYCISISADDSRLVSGARDPHVRVWNLRTIAPPLFSFFPLEPNRGPVCSSVSGYKPDSRPDDLV